MNPKNNGTSKNETDRCAKCGKDVKKDGITRVSCHEKLHVTVKCAGISKASLEKDEKLKKAFLCGKCLDTSDSGEKEVPKAEECNEKLMQVRIKQDNGSRQKMGTEARPILGSG